MNQNPNTPKSNIMIAYATSRSIPIIDIPMPEPPSPAKFLGLPRIYCSECGKKDGHYIGCERSHN